MKRYFVLFFILILTMAFTVSSSMAQAGNDLVRINVRLSCGSITVSLNSDYDEPIKAQVFVGTNGESAWNLLDSLGDYVRAGAKGSGSRTYSFDSQRANTNISYGVHVFSDETNLTVAEAHGTRDCDGPDTAPSTTTNTTTTTTTTTASFLASCNTAGGITVQPIGGVAFTLNATQIAQGTAMAIANGQNFAIATVGNISAIGTPANSVQFVATDGYSLIIPAASCAQTVTVYTPNTNTSASSQASALSCSSTPADAVSTHVVRAGENLFRIGLRYGVHFTRLASYNGIPDATRIFVGQCIAIPPSA